MVLSLRHKNRYTDPQCFLHRLLRTFNALSRSELFSGENTIFGDQPAHWGLAASLGWALPVPTCPYASVLPRCGVAWHLGLVSGCTLVARLVTSLLTAKGLLSERGSVESAPCLRDVVAYGAHVLARPRGGGQCPVCWGASPHGTTAHLCVLPDPMTTLSSPGRLPAGSQQLLAPARP